MIVGGPDVDARLALMRRLKHRHAMVAAGSEPVLGTAFRKAGFEYHFYPLSRGNRPWMDLYSGYRLWRIFLQRRPALVHTYDTKPCIWGRFAAALARVPTIAGTITGLGTLYADERC